MRARIAKRGAVLPALAVCVALLYPLGAARADWPDLGRAICLAAGDQRVPRIASDGSGGAIIVWQDLRSAKVNVFARRVFASGEPDPAWPVDGRALLGDSVALGGALGGQQFPVIAPDGAGGAIVAWQDERFDHALDIFAQHVLASGVIDPAWPVNGRALCTATGLQDIPTIVSDGAGGAVVTWMDARDSVSQVDLYAQHVLASGAIDRRWPVNGVAISTAPSIQASPNIASDGSGGAIITWHDFRPSASGIDIYAQHVSAAGVVDPAWPVNGRGLSLAGGFQLNPTIVSDGAHGALVTWEDSRDGIIHIYAQRVLGSGAIAQGWPADGRAVCLAPGDQIRPLVASDGANGALIAWLDARNLTNHNVYAQHVLAGGAIDPAWPVDGRALTLSIGEALTSSIVSDGAGGAIVAWEEDFFVMIHHVQSSGALDPEFPVNGRFVRLNLDFQRTPDLCTAGAGKAIVAWSNRPSPGSSDIYAMIVTTSTPLSVDPGPTGQEVAFLSPVPNPARESLVFRFALPRETGVRLVLYDASGRRVRELVSEVRSVGTHGVPWDLRDDRGNAVGAGLYFAQLVADGRTLGRQCTVLR